MPAEYQCYSCGVCFSVGWFHYHQYDEYGAATYLVCAECGTWHSVQHACDRNTTPDQLCAHPGPIFRKIDPALLISLQRRTLEGKRYADRSQKWQSRKLRWRRSRPTRAGLNLMPPSRAIKAWRKLKPGLEIVGGILAMPVLFVMVLPILISVWHRSRHSRKLDMDRDWCYLSAPSEIVLPHMRAVSNDTQTSPTTRWPGTNDTFHHLTCSHCKAAALTAEWQGKTCPHCKRDQLELLSSWMT